MTEPNERRDAALRYAEMGLFVLPLFGINEAGKCECRNPKNHDPDEWQKYAKHPRITGGWEAATTDAEKITEWWSMWPLSNVGISPSLSGHSVTDIDPAKGGALTFYRLVRAAPTPLPETWTVETGSGGFHLYWKEITVSGTDLLGPGVDTKSHGGLVVAPPSIHGSGRKYRWTRFDGDAAPLPDWLRPPEKANPDQITIREIGEPFGLAYAMAAVMRECMAAAARKDGEHRRDELFDAGLRTSRFVTSGDLHLEHIEDPLTEAGVMSGLSPEVARQHAHNGLLRGLRNAGIAS